MGSCCIIHNGLRLLIACNTRLVEMLPQVGSKEGLRGTRVKGGLLRLDCLTNNVHHESAFKANDNASNSMHGLRRWTFDRRYPAFGALLIILVTNQNIQPPSLRWTALRFCEIFLFQDSSSVVNV